MSLKMSYLQIIGLKTDLKTVVDTLYQLGCVQLDRYSDLPELAVSRLALDASTIRAQEEISLAAMRINGLLDLLGIHDDTPVQGNMEEIQGPQILAGIAELLPTAQMIGNRRKKLQAELDLLPRFEGTLRKLLPLLPQISRGSDHALFGLFISKAHPQTLDQIREHIQNVTQGEAEIGVGDVDDATQAMLIAVSKRVADQIGQFFDQQDIARLRLPSGFDATAPDAAIAALRRRMESIPGELAAIEREMAELAAEWSPRLLAWRLALRGELAKYEALSSLGQTEYTFVLIGWAPTREMERIRAALYDAVGERALLQEQPLTHETQKRVPVVFSNLPPARPFESLTRLYGIPPYGRADPTSLIAVFLPIFFGLMLGDVGYGVLLLALSLLLRFRIKKGILRDLLDIMAVGSGWAIGFGFLFGEAFGTLGEHLGMRPLWFDRASSDHVLDLLLLTIAIGAAHITLGLLIGLWEGFCEKNSHHLLERGGRLLGLMAAFLIVGVLADLLPAGFMTVGIAGLIVGVALLAAPLGRVGLVMAPIEMIGLFGNVLSYLRIAAIGLASVYLARVANELAGAVGNLIIGVIIAVLLHALNLVLGAFSPSIHSLRLHYVEFFRNFYEGGGRAYQPFGSNLAPRQ